MFRWASLQVELCSVIIECFTPCSCNTFNFWPLYSLAFEVETFLLVSKVFLFGMLAFCFAKMHNIWGVAFSIWGFTLFGSQHWLYLSRFHQKYVRCWQYVALHRSWLYLLRHRDHRHSHRMQQCLLVLCSFFSVYALCSSPSSRRWLYQGSSFSLVDASFFVLLPTAWALILYTIVLGRTDPSNLVVNIGELLFTLLHISAVISFLLVLSIFLAVYLACRCWITFLHPISCFARHS